MEYLLICPITFVVSLLTLYTGFGLGTLLMPFFVLFFPVPLAISLTAFVHLTNNLFKAALLGKYANKSIVIRFGVPAIFSAFLGAWLLAALTDMAPIGRYELGGKEYAVTPLKVIIALIILLFVMLDKVKLGEKLFKNDHGLLMGGIMSGFFGGLSGHQGAFRSAFLVRCNLTKESFIATGVLIACFVDIIRLTVYGRYFLLEDFMGQSGLLTAVILSAFLGVWVGKRFLKKMAFESIHKLISALLIIMSLGLISGII